MLDVGCCSHRSSFSRTRWRSLLTALLALAFSACSVLSYPEFVRLISHMLHTGHFAAETALHRTQAWPPEFRFSTPQELADQLYSELGLKPQQSAIRLQDFAAAAEALALSKKTRLTAWYLPQGHLGFFKSARLKWQEEAMRLYRTRKLGAPLAGIAAEREQARVQRIAQLKVDRAKIAERVAAKQKEQQLKQKQEQGGAQQKQTAAAR
jgi:hypothetical protein